MGGGVALHERLRGGDDGNIIPLTRPWKKGQTYGTILVDLEKHATIELLPDRKEETLTAWLRTHPEIEVISRDRGGEYAAAAKKGAPQAQQIADKFHLVKNLREGRKRAHGAQAESVTGSGGGRLGRHSSAYPGTTPGERSLRTTRTRPA
jgi:hypothetical protein